MWVKLEKAYKNWNVCLWGTSDGKKSTDHKSFKENFGTEIMMGVRSILEGSVDRLQCLINKAAKTTLPGFRVTSFHTAWFLAHHILHFGPIPMWLYIIIYQHTASSSFTYLLKFSFNWHVVIIYISMLYVIRSLFSIL